MRARARGTRPAMPRKFDVLAIDEAQEFSALELALVGRSVAEGGALIVSGDADQRAEPGAFSGWDAVMRELGVPEYRQVTLPISHRCPPHVEALARALREGRPIAPDPRTLVRGAPTVLTGYADERTLAHELGKDIDVVLRRDRRASLAVLCRS